MERNTPNTDSIIIEERKNHESDKDISKWLWNIENNGKIPTNGKIDINKIFGDTVYVVGIIENGPICKKTFIEEVGSDSYGDYFKVNKHIKGATLFFSEESALKLFEELKKKYIEEITIKYKKAIDDITKLEADTNTPIIEDNYFFGNILSVFGDEKETTEYNEELKPTIEIGQTVYITLVPGEIIGSVINRTTNNNFRIIETEVTAISIGNYADGLQLSYKLDNGDSFASGREEFKKLFTDLEEAKKFIEKLRTNFLELYSGEILVEKDTNEEEKKKNRPRENNK